MHRLAASFSTQAATPGPCVAELAESRKISKYSAISQTHFFVSVAVETLGGLGPSTLDFVNDLGRWARLFRAATSCLRQPDRGGTRKRKSLATILNQQIQEFENADNDRLLVAGNRISGRTMKQKWDPALNTGRKIYEKFDEGDVRGAVRLASSDATIAPFDSTTLEKLESKHPRTPLDIRV